METVAEFIMDGSLRHVLLQKDRQKEAMTHQSELRPVDGRFEHIVLSYNATSLHAIIWIEKEAQRDLNSKTQERLETNALPMSRIRTIIKAEITDLHVSQETFVGD
ncbi:hypothetical protein RYX36_033502 [Vicia faba]